MNLSKNFTLKELLKSNTADRLSIKEQYKPNEEVVSNLKALCENILQPIRDSLKKPLRVTSGYRCNELNKVISGSSRSQHVKGEAVDIELWVNGVEKNGVLLDEILSLYFRHKLMFDQLIIEYPDKNDVPKWVHISYNAKHNRGEILIAKKNINNKTYYINSDEL